MELTDHEVTRRRQTAGVQAAESDLASKGPGDYRRRREPAYAMKANRSRRDDVAEVHSSLEALEELYRAHPSMESVLQTASRLVGEMLNLEHCSVGWFDGQDLSFRIRTSHTKEGANIDPNQAVLAFSDWVRKVRSGKTQHAQSLHSLMPKCDSEQALRLTAPLRVDKQIIGYLYGLRVRSKRAGLLDTERSLFATLTFHINAAIGAHRAREMVRSPYTALLAGALEKQWVDGISLEDLPCVGSGGDPEKFERNVARRFFGDLRGAGFETKQILTIATEMLGSVNEALRKKKSGQQNG